MGRDPRSACRASGLSSRHQERAQHVRRRTGSVPEHVNVASIPYNRREGDVPALNEQEIDALVAFLQTLTDAR